MLNLRHSFKACHKQQVPMIALFIAFIAFIRCPFLIMFDQFRASLEVDNNNQLHELATETQPEASTMYISLQ